MAFPVLQGRGSLVSDLPSRAPQNFVINWDQIAESAIDTAGKISHMANQSAMVKLREQELALEKELAPAKLSLAQAQAATAAANSKIAEGDLAYKKTVLAAQLPGMIAQGKVMQLEAESETMRLKSGIVEAGIENELLTMERKKQGLTAVTQFESKYGNRMLDAISRNDVNEIVKIDREARMEIPNYAMVASDSKWSIASARQNIAENKRAELDDKMLDLQGDAISRKMELQTRKEALLDRKRELDKKATGKIFSASDLNLVDTWTVEQLLSPDSFMQHFDEWAENEFLPKARTKVSLMSGEDKIFLQEKIREVENSVVMHKTEKDPAARTQQLRTDWKFPLGFSTKPLDQRIEVGAYNIMKNASKLMKSDDAKENTMALEIFKTTTDWLNSFVSTPRDRVGKREHKIEQGEHRSIIEELNDIAVEDAKIDLLIPAPPPKRIIQDHNVNRTGDRPGPAVSTPQDPIAVTSKEQAQSLPEKAPFLDQIPGSATYGKIVTR